MERRAIILVKTNSSDDAKFVINLEGVTILGAFTETPTPQEGGMFIVHLVTFT